MIATINTESVWRSFSDELRPFIFRRVKDKDLANDILQDVFIKVHQKLDHLKEEDKLGSWVYSITRNTISDHFRNRKTISLENEKEVMDDEPLLNGHSFEECLIPFINALPNKYKEALMHTEIYGISQKEYADVAGITYSGAKSRVQRARLELKKLFVACCNPKTDVYGNVVEKDEVEGCPINASFSSKRSQ